MSGSGSAEQIRVLVNPRAGHGAALEIASLFLAEAARHGHEAALLPTHSARAAIAATKKAVSDGIDRLIVIGGDGTVHQAIQATALTPVVMGVIPAGTGNDLTRALGLDSFPDRAVDRALGPPTPIDLLRIGDRYGATVVTLGFSVAVNRRAETMRWPRGPARYTAAAIRELSRLRRYPMALELDGRRFYESPNLLAVANTAIFGGGMRVAPDARPDDGQMDVVVVGPASRSTMLRLLPRVRSGRHVEHAAVSIYQGTRLKIETDEAHEIRADGEIVGSTPIEIEVAPAALQLAGLQGIS